MDGNTSAVSMNRSRQLGYGTADLGIAAVESIVQLYLLKFYSEVVGLSAAWVGIALAVAMIWDAISDPLMGGISDFEDHGRTVMTEKMAQLLFANGKFININFYAPLKLNYDIHRRYMFPQSSISNAN